MSKDLLSEIEAFLTETGMHEHRFGILAARNGRLVERLRSGTTPNGRRHRIWPETETQVRAFMIAHRQQPKKASAA